MKIREEIMRRLRLRFPQEWSSYTFACYWPENDGKPQVTVPTILGFIAELIANYVACLVCKWRGHHWDVDSHAGPDSGYEDFHCLRCGESHHVTYY